MNLGREHGWNRILIEAGPKLMGAFIKNGLFDEIYLYQAPTILGGNMDFTRDLETSTLSDRIDFDLTEVKVLESSGRNLRIRLTPLNAKGGIR